ncbi:hypothetical protein A9174_15910 [Mesorhizobium loti NZP2037]|nr:hypothetical protein A9174_15910 [Mesorhizobium loti NZP2037]
MWQPTQCMPCRISTAMLAGHRLMTSSMDMFGSIRMGVSFVVLPTSTVAEAFGRSLCWRKEGACRKME